MAEEEAFLSVVPTDVDQLAMSLGRLVLRWPTRPMFDVALPAASHLGRVVSAAVQKTLMVFDVAAAPLIDALVEACPDVDTAARLCELAPDWPWLDHAPLIRRGLFSGRCLALLFTSLPPAVLRVLEQLLSDLASSTPFAHAAAFCCLHGTTVNDRTSDELADLFDLEEADFDTVFPADPDSGDLASLAVSQSPDFAESPLSLSGWPFLRSAALSIPQDVPVCQGGGS